MKNLQKKMNYLYVALLVTAYMPIFSHAEEFADDAKGTESRGFENHREDSCDKVKVGNLDAKKVKAKCVDTKKLEAFCAEIDNLHAQDLTVTRNAILATLCTSSFCANSIIATSLDADAICANHINSGDGRFSYLTTLTACVGDLAVNDLCISGTLRTANLLNCGKYRATVTYSTNTTYTLGDLIDFDTVLDDPNGDVTVAGSTQYHVPVSGYYIITFQLDQINLQTSDGPILGVPVAFPQVLINGIQRRALLAPFLSFFNEQAATLTFLASLKAGDVVEMKYEVLAINQSVGQISLSGTVDIIGNGTEDIASVFKISLLNVDCIDLPCAPISCAPIQPCTPRQCIPSCVTPAPCGPCESCVPCCQVS